MITSDVFRMLILVVITNGVSMSISLVVFKWNFLRPLIFTFRYIAVGIFAMIVSPNNPA